MRSATVVFALVTTMLRHGSAEDVCDTVPAGYVLRGGGDALCAVSVRHRNEFLPPPFSDRDVLVL